jgi:hypothetical protein
MSKSAVDFMRLSGMFPRFERLARHPGGVALLLPTGRMGPDGPGA